MNLNGMNKLPIISVIITTYNRADLIQRAIISVLNQTYKDFELIIVDDGSIDNTKEIIEKFKNKDSRIKYFYQENQGWPSALNKGLSLAQGEYIAFLDSDDEWLPQKLEKQIEVFENNLSVGLVACWAFRIFDSNKKKLFKTHKGLIKKENWCKFFKTKGIISFSTVILKKKVFDSIVLFDTKLKAAIDLDFYIRIINKFDVYFLPTTLVNYYESTESLSKKNFWLKWIPDLEYLLSKHQNVINQCSPLKIYLLKTLATCYLLNGEYKKSRYYLLRSIKIQPFKIRLYFQYLLALYPNIYKNILFFKRKLS